MKKRLFLPANLLIMFLVCCVSYGMSQDRNWDNQLYIGDRIAGAALVTFAAGAFYRWQNNFTGFQYIRFGPGITYIFNEQHTLNFNHLISATNNGVYWEWAGIPVIQLVINITRKYKYVPAKYFDL